MSHNRDKVSVREGLATILSTGSALLIMILGVSLWRYESRLFGLSPDASTILNQAIGACSIATLLLSIARYLLESRWVYFAYAGVSALMGVVVLLLGLPLLMDGPKGRGSAASGIGFLIGLVVTTVGVAGLLSAIIGMKEGKTLKDSPTRRYRQPR